MTSSYPSWEHSRGLTLIEIMVVIAIISIVAAIAVPSYNNAIDSQRFTAALEAVLSDVRWARSEAIKRSALVQITFTTGSSWSYTVVADTNNSNSIDVNDTTIKSATSTDYPTVTMSSTTFTNNKVTFNPARGTANSGHVLLTSAGGKTARTTISVLGRTRICGFGGYESCTP